MTGLPLDRANATGSDDDGELIARSGLFDLNFYTVQAGRTFRDEAEAIADYDAQGWRAGLRPSRHFDTPFYLKRNADIAQAGMNPLLHYIRAGRREGRKPRLGRGLLADRPAAPSPERWQALAGALPAPGEDSPESVDVVIPVYRGFADTLACIESVLSSVNRTPYRLVVIDDASPEAELSNALDALASRGLFTLLRNPQNLGFVETANRGFKLSRSRDVLLLNADTIVNGDWLDRIRAHAQLDQRVATVTPMSNNATILSYPYAPGNNNQQLELDSAALDQLFARANAGLSAEIPTGVGFCFYVTRAALEALGQFDQAFSPGYGEENDFCMRAQAAGWRNRAALDVYVRHTGETSFLDSGERKAIAAATLSDRYPTYDDQVRMFMATDPLRPARARVDLLRAATISAGRGVLMLEHALGGGVARHVRELAGLLGLEDVHCFRARPDEAGENLLLEPTGEFDLPNLPSLPLSDANSMAAMLRELNLSRAHIHSLVDYPLDSFPVLLLALRRARLRYDFTWHDYAPLCPRLSMVDWGGVYCDSPSVEYCQVCVEKAGTRFGLVDVRRWRATYDEVLRQARRNIVPDEDVADRVGRYAPAIAPLVRPHPDPTRRPARRVTPSQEELRIIGVLGRIGPLKGSSVLLRLAGDALERDLPVRYRLWGTTNRTEFGRFPHVELMGEYVEDDLEARLAAHPPSLLFFPSVCPETFSFTFNAAFSTGLHPVCFDVGAPARRARASGIGTVLPLQLALAPSALNDALLSLEPDIPSSLSGPTTPSWIGQRRYYDRVAVREWIMRRIRRRTGARLRLSSDQIATRVELSDQRKGLIETQEAIALSRLDGARKN